MKKERKKENKQPMTHLCECHEAKMVFCLPHLACCKPQTHVARTDAHRSVGVHVCACRWTHVCAHMHPGNPKPVSGITPVTLNSQRQASWASLVLLASLLLGIPFSVFSGYNYKWSTAPTQHLQDFQGSELQASWSLCLGGKCFGH